MCTIGYSLDFAWTCGGKKDTITKLTNKKDKQKEEREREREREEIKYHQYKFTI